MKNNKADFQKVYPVRVGEEERLTRKQFLLAFVFSTAALLLGRKRMGKWLKEATPSGRYQAPVKASQLAVGGSVQFQISDGKIPVSVTRLSESSYVSFCQKCTHLSCPVHYLHEKKQFHCPCHEGVFDAATGAPLAGPPREPLQRYEVEVVRDDIFIRLA